MEYHVVDWLLQARCRYFSTTLRGRLPYCLCRPMFSFRRCRVLLENLDECSRPTSRPPSSMGFITTSLRVRCPAGRYSLLHIYAAACLMPPPARSSPVVASRLCVVPSQRRVLPQELRRTISLRVRSSMLQPASSGSLLQINTLSTRPPAPNTQAYTHHSLFHSAEAMAMNDIPIVISYCFQRLESNVMHSLCLFLHVGSLAFSRLFIR